MLMQVIVTVSAVLSETVETTMLAGIINVLLAAIGCLLGKDLFSFSLWVQYPGSVNHHLRSYVPFNILSHK